MSSFEDAVRKRMNSKATAKVEVLDEEYMVMSCGDGTCDMWSDHTVIRVDGVTVWTRDLNDGSGVGFLTDLFAWLDGGA